MYIKLSDPGALAKCAFKYQIGDRVRVGGGDAFGEITDGYCNCVADAGTYSEITYQVRMESGATMDEYESKLEKV